jgi:predicted aspartyl protease
MHSEEAVGLFSVRIGVAHPTDPSRQAEVELLVDTGATLSWVPREILDPLGVPRLGRRPFPLADGRQIGRETAGVVMRLDGTQALVTVVAGEPGDGRLLGATALETLGYGVDPIGRRLVPHTLLAM